MRAGAAGCVRLGELAALLAAAGCSWPTLLARLLHFMASVPTSLDQGSWLGISRLSWALLLHLLALCGVAEGGLCCLYRWWYVLQ